MNNNSGRLSFITGFFKKFSIKTKLMLIAIIFIVYPIVIIGYFGYRNYADVMKEKAINSMHSSAKDMTNQLSDRMTKLSLFSVQILYDNTIYNAARDSANGSMDYLEENKFTSYLQSNLFLKSELEEILIQFKKRNKVIQVNKSMGTATESGKIMDELHSQALAGKGRPVWYVSQKPGKSKGIYITKIIYDISDIKRETGFLVFKVNEKYISEVLSNYISTTRQNVSLYSSNGLEVFTFKTFNTAPGKLLDSFAEPGVNSGSREINIGNDTVYLLYDTISPDNWRLVTGISSNVLLKDVRDIARFILILCFATLPICMLLVNFLYKDMVKPLNLLIKRMRQIQKGDIGVVIESRRRDEFGFVFATFNKMSLEIKNLINTVYRKQIATKDAEIKALQAQINPHFLYNTLDSINWKAKINGVDEISEMVSALSSIIEANLNRQNENLIPLAKEIEYINNYYLLLQKRFGKKIALVTDIEEAALGCIIPKLIIQPIIENAVHHGLEMKVGNGTVTLNVHKEQDKVLITVNDDGIGITEKTMSDLQRCLDKPVDSDLEDNGIISSSIGIINVHKRIRLLYGDAYGLSIKSGIGEGTSVVISLPAKPPEGVEDINDKSADN